MPYNYVKSYLPISNTTQKDRYKNLFQETLNRQFANASDVWVIEEQNPYASENWLETEVRIVTNVIANETGQKLGEDYRKLLFKDLSHATGVGWMYWFDDNYWLTINTDIGKNLAASSLVKRCNNVLRWIDDQGGKYEVPCSIDYLIKENRDFATAGTALVAPAAQLEVICQWNEVSNKIRPNQRFLFGNRNNWNAYRVLGGGVNNFNNMLTEDNESAGLLRLSMMANYVNPDTDDLVNGIADVYANVYLITTETISAIEVSEERQIDSTVTYNGETVSRTLIYTSDDEDVATVDSAGLITAVAVGTCNIRVELENNSSVYVVIPITVQVTPVSEFEINMSPNKNYILEKQTSVFTVNLYENDVVQPDTFTFTLNPNSISYENYEFIVIDGNSFSIKNNKKVLTDVLEVTCESGSYSRVFEFSLKGAWL